MVGKSVAGRSGERLLPREKITTSIKGMQCCVYHCEVGSHGILLLIITTNNIIFVLLELDYKTDSSSILYFGAVIISSDVLLYCIQV